MRTWIRYPVMFVVLVLLQVLLFNQIHLGGFLNPFMYVLFILLLPLSMPRYAVLLLSFFLGMTIDWFSNSPGLHASASVLMGFLRSPVISLITQKESEQSDYPGLQQTGWRWFLTYAVFLVVIHHLFLFFIEVFSFENFFRTLLRSLASSVFTLVMIFLSQFIIFRE
ncbi:MAG: rod shape-determining protein MreD [Prolixibacteraceae bacterium]|jgi:rod shape-determining protein MreD|nr:rod shape-determining protein MreD [Prolixibacteraceae bacterium]NLX30099.1 rod shape-determining protein MreD [Bacteroidales bacterium]HPJ78460.1 rod shape-determining protein MreD [Prolixibacteraceae bacterium]HRV89614.1 rod shape-determining protein MreD [Prolixibacteraceae bacterium]